MNQRVIAGRRAREFRDKELLVGLRLFEGVALEAVEGYMDGMAELRLEPEDILLEPDQPNEHIYLVLEGRLRVHLTTLDSAPLVQLEAGECVGEMSIIDNARTSAYVVATVPTRLLVIDQKILWLLINNVNGVARNLLYVLASRVRSDNHLIMDAIEAQRVWEQHAMVDALTGLHNRRWLQQTLDRLIERSRRDGSCLSLLMGDLDHFKKFNDEFGHLAGDLVLGAVARTLHANMRPNDMAVRFGGEEFVIVLPGTQLEDAMVMAERLRLAVSVLTVDTRDGVRLPSVSISIGVAEMHDDMDATFLINAADAALYRAKAQGRNRVAS